MPTLKEVLAGYEAANAWQDYEERTKLPEMSVRQSIRQYLDMWDLAMYVSPDAEARFLAERLKHYQFLHERLAKAAEVMGCVGKD